MCQMRTSQVRRNHVAPRTTIDDPSKTHMIVDSFARKSDPKVRCVNGSQISANHKAITQTHLPNLETGK